MVWIAFVIGIVAALVATAGILTKRRSPDLGVVSTRWIAQHRTDG